MQNLQTSNGPLAGVTVVEVAAFIAGPYLAMLLGDLGADVVKVEMPETGDPFREWGEDRGASPQFAAFNRNKRSVEIDIKSDAGRRSLLGLLRNADVVVENLRPGKMAALGFSPEELHRLNPRLVYCSVSGMGPTGPASGLPSYDAIAQARSGLWSLLTERDSPTAIGPALSDQITSLYGVQGTLAALVSREKTGQGQVVQVNMLAASMAFLTAPIAEYTMLGGVDGPYTRARRSLSFAFLSKDELSFAVHLSSPAKFWDGLLAAVNAGHLARDSRFKDKSARVEHYRELHSLLAQIFRTRTRADWLNELWEHNVPAAPIYDIAEALSDPQAVHLDMVQAFGQGDDAIELVRYPVTFERTPCDRRDGVPRLGQHNDYYGISERD